MLSIFTVLGVLNVTSELKAEARWNIWYMSVTLLTSQSLRGWLNAVAESNIDAMLVTLLTSQCEILGLKLFWQLMEPIKSLIDVTGYVSHVEIWYPLSLRWYA